MLKTITTALIYAVYLVLLAAHKLLCWVCGEADHTGGRWT